jgi:hypothetical protein
VAQCHGVWGSRPIAAQSHTIWGAVRCVSTTAAA